MAPPVRIRAHQGPPITEAIPINENGAADDRAGMSGQRGQDAHTGAPPPSADKQPTKPSASGLILPEAESGSQKSTTVPATRQLVLDLGPDYKAAAESSAGTAAGRKRRPKRGGPAATAAEQGLLLLDWAPAIDEA
jgi:hypothetical protein